MQMTYAIYKSPFLFFFYQRKPRIPPIRALSLEENGADSWISGLSVVHSKFPHVVTVLCQGSNNVVTILSPTSGSSEELQTMYLCHLDSYSDYVFLGT